MILFFVSLVLNVVKMLKPKRSRFLDPPISEKNAGKIFAQLINNPRIAHFENVHIGEMETTEKDITFDLTFFNHTQKVNIEFTPREVLALKKVVGGKILNVERWASHERQTVHEMFGLSAVEISALEEIKQDIQNFIERNKEKPHISFCSNHLKWLLVKRDINVSRPEDTYHYVKPTPKEQRNLYEPILFGGDFIIIDLLLYCSARTCDRTTWSPHLTSVIMHGNAREMADYRPIFQAFGANYLIELEHPAHMGFQRKPFITLVMSLIHANRDYKEDLLKELLADKKSQHFEADVAPEVVARFLTLGFEMTFNRLHKICIFCVRRDWQHELTRSIELLIFFLERVPKKTLNEALAKAFMNCCANFAVKKIPNMIYNMLSIVLGVPIIHNCYLCDMTRALKPEEFGQKSEKLTPRSLKTFAMKSTNKFLSKYDNVAGYHIEKIVRFPFLPNALKRDLLWPKNTHTTIKKWKDEMRHYCDDHREDREELRKEHTQMTETIGKFFLQKLVKQMSRKGLFEEGDKVEDFVFEMLKKPLCGGVSPPWQNPFDDDFLFVDCEHL